LQLPFERVLRAAACVFRLKSGTFFVLHAAKTGCGFQTSFTIHIIINMNYYYYIKPDSSCQSGGDIFCGAARDDVLPGLVFSFFPRHDRM